MKHIPKPIFQERLQNIIWKKIYAREYGVQYSEMALLCLSPKANYHIPKPSVDQVIIPDENNTVFYIDETSWNNLIDSLNQKYTSDVKELEKYEKQFTIDGTNYVSLAEKISQLDFASLSNEDLKNYYLDYQEKLFTYSVFAWTSFILNMYVSDRATTIIDTYIEKKIISKIKDKKL